MNGRDPTMNGGTRLVPTGSQTVGPFFAIGLGHLCSGEVTQPAPAGERSIVSVEGQVLDGDGLPVPDAFLEVWQADVNGRYSDETDLLDLPAHAEGDRAAFPGFARIATAQDGSFRFATVRPGAVPYDDQRMQAPHLLVLVFMRGLLRNLVTRMYFPDPANASDPVLQLVAEERRATLLASEVGESKYRWELRLRGERETVFFQW